MDIWRKMRQLGGVFAKEGFFSAPNDIFLLKRDEVNEALWDMYSAWAVGTSPRGPHYWPRELGRRKAILDTLRGWSPPPAKRTSAFSAVWWTPWTFRPPG